ncbi:MAG: DUF59 domain-containing protein [Bacteroidales bacterium]|jgi:FeS assembly SUF system protein|nr:DUF59 domain-containing protein [Bacteroidales bacterium]
MITKEQVIEVLKKIYDPEIPVDIWELGLIYDIDIKGDDVTILMTVTAPNCPIAETLPVDVRNDVSKIEGVGNVVVNLTFDPPWDMSRLSEAAQLELGWM